MVMSFKEGEWKQTNATIDRTYHSLGINRFIRNIAATAGRIECDAGSVDNWNVRKLCRCRGFQCGQQ